LRFKKLYVKKSIEIFYKPVRKKLLSEKKKKKKTLNIVKDLDLIDLVVYMPSQMDKRILFPFDLGKKL
jgi:hypothetical protein